MLERFRTTVDYPMQTLTPTPDHIMWIFDGAWSILDNFALTPVTVDIGRGILTYATSEHAYAAAKAMTKVGHDSVYKAKGPGAAKSIGRGLRLRPDWQEVKFDIMWRVLVAKFEQHPKAVRVLLSTGERPIYEGNSWDDQIWGVTRQGVNVWSGRNALGEMLMELRRNYQPA